jgi:hypothetical protein
MYVAGGSQLLYDDLLLTNLMYTLHTCIYFQLKLALSMGDCFNNEQVSAVENSPTLDHSSAGKSKESRTEHEHIYKLITAVPSLDRRSVSRQLGQLQRQPRICRRRWDESCSAFVSSCATYNKPAILCTHDNR